MNLFGGMAMTEDQKKFWITKKNINYEIIIINGNTYFSFWLNYIIYFNDSHTKKKKIIKI